MRERGSGSPSPSEVNPNLAILEETQEVADTVREKAQDVVYKNNVSRAMTMVEQLNNYLETHKVVNGVLISEKDKSFLNQ